MVEERSDELFDPDTDEIEVIYGGEEDEQVVPVSEPRDEMPEVPVGEDVQWREETEKKLAEVNEKYLRLYAEFENYRKRVNKDKEELAKFANESLLYELLPSIDHLEIALKHVEQGTSRALVEGVEMTLRELYRTLEKFGLRKIEAEGKPFDPEFHHAVAQVERDDLPEKMVVEELRKGFVYRDKVLRASMVSVSKRPESGSEDYD